MNKELALKGLEIKARIDALNLELKQITTQLLEEVGDGGESITLPGGRVTVTQRTEDRPSGTYVQKFDREKFDALEETDALRKKILSAGIVSFEQGVTRGRAPIVQFKLNTPQSA